jgi:hypothetical protein
MSFLNPNLFLAALACVAIPILIHILLRRRRKPVAWAAMRFLLEAYRQQRRRTRLEQLLLLASRCLLVAALALAVGRPALRTAGFFSASDPRTLVIILDNALTTAVTTPEGSTEFERERARALALLRELSPARGDAAALLTTAAPAAAIINPPSTDLAGVMDALARVTPADSASDLPAALALARQTLAARPPGTAGALALCSPWRSADTARPLPTLEPSPRFKILASPPASRDASNITITALLPTRGMLIAPDSQTTPVPASVRVELRRSGRTPAASTTVTLRALALSAAASPPVSATFAWSPGQTSAAVAINLDIPPDFIRQGPALTLLATTNADDLPLDDLALRPLVARRQVRVALLAPRAPITDAGARPDLFSAADWLALALAPTASALDRRGAEIEVARLDPSAAGVAADLAAADAIFITAPDRLDAALLAALRRSLDAGRLLVLMPPSAPSASAAWAELMTQALAAPFTLAAEPKTFDPEVGLAMPAPGITASNSSGGGGGLLTLLAPELPDLLRPVRVTRSLPAIPDPSRTRTLLALTDATPLVLVSSPDADAPSRGTLLYLAAAPELAWTNLPAMPLMLPLVQEILRQGLGESAASTLAYAGRPVPPQPASTLHFRRIPLPEPVAPRSDAPLALPTPPAFAALYRTTNADNRTQGVLAIAPDPDAGLITPTPPADLTRWLAAIAGPQALVTLADASAAAAPPAETPSSSTLGNTETETPWDLIILLLAVSLAIVELLLARLFSHASLSSRAPGLSATYSTALPKPPEAAP